MLICVLLYPSLSLFFFFNDTATTEIYTLSLHDALPIYGPEPDLPGAAQLRPGRPAQQADPAPRPQRLGEVDVHPLPGRSEEHTSELQSRLHLVCRLLLEKKKKNKHTTDLSAHTSKE